MLTVMVEQNCSWRWQVDCGPFQTSALHPLLEGLESVRAGLVVGVIMLSNGDGDIARMLTEATHFLIVWASCVWLVWRVTVETGCCWLEGGCDRVCLLTGWWWGGWWDVWFPPLKYLPTYQR